MALVDPFIPVKKQALPGLVNNIPRPKSSDRSVGAPPQRLIIPDKRAAVTSMIRQVTSAHHRIQASRPRPIEQSIAQPQVQQPKAKQPQAVTKQAVTSAKKSRRWPFRLLLKLRLPLAFAAMFAGGMLLQSLLFGQIAILVYAALAIVRRIPSSTTLTLAGISLISIVILNVKDPANALIGTFAIYAFLLLTVGVITLIREIYGQQKEASEA